MKGVVLVINEGAWYKVNIEYTFSIEKRFVMPVGVIFIVAIVTKGV